MRQLFYYLPFFLLLIIPTEQVFPNVRAKHAMVVSGNQKATEAGIEILKRGGNAIDAAVAVGYALAVTFPEAGNIGGGGFALIRKKDGTSYVVDFRETAPKRSTSTMYLDNEGKTTDKSVNGQLSAGVPGTVAGFAKMIELGGKMNMSDVIAPAIRLAEEGVIVDRHLESNLEDYKNDLLKYPSTAKLYSKQGEILKEGDTLRLPELAETLRRIQEQGTDGFYKGTTARLIVEEMKRNGGIISEEDLSEYSVIVRKPIKGMYRGYEVLSCPPPSAGGITLLQMLGMMEQFTFEPSDFHSSRTIHLMIEAMKHAYADRYEYASDPGFVHVPVDSLLSAPYLNNLKTEIDTTHATPAKEVRHEKIEIEEGNNTTHFVVADEEGNIVSVTYTLNDLFGSKVIVSGAGFFLNDEMDDFATKPGSPNIYGLPGTEKNIIAPGKRPVSSMTPTIVLKDNVPFLALGARGGPRIITAVFQVMMNVIDFKMDIERAVNERRFHHQLFPDTLKCEEYCLPNDVITNLEQRGQNVRQGKIKLAAIEALYRDPKTGWFYSGEDRREGGFGAGY